MVPGASKIEWGGLRGLPHLFLTSAEPAARERVSHCGLKAEIQTA
jgi:hypothetical protein